MRPSVEQTMMAMAHVAAQRSKCTRMKVGAVVTDKHDRVLSTGYNGEPASYEGPRCPRETAAVRCPNYSDCIAVHAEVNAVIYANGCRDGTLYVTNSPCFDCARIIAAAGIALVVTEDEQNRGGNDFLASCGIDVRRPKAD